jgi:hypothetical protein
VNSPCWFPGRFLMTRTTSRNEFRLPIMEAQGEGYDD